MEGKNLTVGSLDKFDIFRLRNFPFFQFFTGNGNFSRVGKLSFAKISKFFQVQLAQTAYDQSDAILFVVETNE